MHRGLHPASSVMTANCLVLSLLQTLVALLLSSASASQFNTTEACNFTFSLGDLPNFRVPEAGPNSPGDVQLNVGNNIITRGWLGGENGSLGSCNGDSGAYYVGGDTWNTTYISNDGDELDIDVFYATYHNQLWVRHLQPHMDPSLYEVLNDTIIRLNITCWGTEGLELNEIGGCIEFTANFTEATPYEYSEMFEFVDDCSHGFSSGLQVPPVQVHAASPIGPTNSASLGTGITLILAGKADQGLPWSEGFTTNGSKKTDEFWGEFWATVNSTYTIEGASDSCNLDIPGIQAKTTCCPASCGTCGGDGCSDRDGGDIFSGAEACCESGVASLGRDCSATGEAPCTLPDYSYLGCYKDMWNTRALTHLSHSTTMTNEECAGICASSKQFATQYGARCWCGPEGEDADYDQHGPAENCNIKCRGDKSEICGGNLALSTYQFHQTAVAANAMDANEENSCNGTSAQVWNPSTGEWLSTFQTIDGESHDIDMFYLNLVDGANELWVTEIESWMAPSLYNQLQYNYVKLSVTCPDDNTVVDSCVIFQPTFTNWSPEVDGAMAGFRFSDPALPTFDLPEAVPNSPGDVLLTTNNEVITKTGAATETFCNGDSAEYYGEDGYWYNQFLKSDGEANQLLHVFYPFQRNLYAATVQANWEPNLRGLLENRTLRIRVWCTNDERAQFLFFRVSGESSTCDDIDDLCTDVIESEALQLVPTFAQCATTAAAAYLGWLSTGS